MKIMSEQWIKIAAFKEDYKAEMVKSFLEVEEILCKILNKKDAAYVMIGEIEILVLQSDIIRATQIIQNLAL